MFHGCLALLSTRDAGADALLLRCVSEPIGIVTPISRQSVHFWQATQQSARADVIAEDVVSTLDQVCRRIRCPATIRVDLGSEYISRDMDLWAYQRGVKLDISRPGKPTDTAFIEAFNGRFRAECLNSHWFISLEDAAENLA